VIAFSSSQVGGAVWSEDNLNLNGVREVWGRQPGDVVIASSGISSGICEGILLMIFWDSTRHYAATAVTEYGTSFVPDRTIDDAAIARFAIYAPYGIDGAAATHQPCTVALTDLGLQ
jgi:hypothetical protein